jgi:glycosyltransferase involved in cell wall biosynthesis
VKGKVGEAWAHGVPVVLTSLAAEGMDVDPGVTALVADDPISFAAAVISLHRDPELWESVSAAGAIHVDEKFGAERIRDLLAIAIASARER